MATLDGLKNRVLQTLNKLHPGQSATGDLDTKAENAVNAEIANLAKRGVIDYTTATAMPEEDEEAVIIRAAWRARFTVSMSSERYVALREAQFEAYKELCANHEEPHDGEPVEANYY